MNKAIMFFSVVLIFSSQALSQNLLSKYKPMICYIEEVNHNSLADITHSFNEDLSEIWLNEESRVYGFFGPDYCRLRMKFLDVKKDKDNDLEYLISGKSRRDNITRAFRGRLRIIGIYRVKVPTELREYENGMIFGEYTILEDSLSEESGKYTGRFVSYWHRDEKGKIRYNDLWKISDGFNNNQFAGYWQSCHDDQKVRANWGDSRIPCSEDFDRGAGEFSPDEKYRKNGWESYIKAYHEGNNREEIEKFRKIEEQKWWE